MKGLVIRHAVLFGFVAVQLLHASMANEKASSPSLDPASPALEIGFPARQSLIQFSYAPEPGEEPNVEVYLSYRSGGRVRTVHLETIGPEGYGRGNFVRFYP